MDYGLVCMDGRKLGRFFWCITVYLRVANYFKRPVLPIWIQHPPNNDHSYIDTRM